MIRVLEGPLTIVEGMENEKPAQASLWLQIRDAVKDVLEKTTLEDLANYDESDEGPAEAYMFYI